MVDDDVVEQSTAGDSGPAAALEIVVLEVRVLGANYPAFVERIASHSGLLEDVRGDTDAGAVTGRHPERQIGALNVELVRRLVGAGISTVLEIRVQNTGEIDGNRHRSRWRRRRRRSGLCSVGRLLREKRG